MTTWILGVMQWINGYIPTEPYTTNEIIQYKQQLLKKPLIKFIPTELNTKSGYLISVAMSQLTQDELKSLYSCKKALTIQEVVLLLQNNGIA